MREMYLEKLGYLKELGWKFFDLIKDEDFKDFKKLGSSFARLAIFYTYENSIEFDTMKNYLDFEKLGKHIYELMQEIN